MAGKSKARDNTAIARSLYDTCTTLDSNINNNILSICEEFGDLEEELIAFHTNADAELKTSFESLLDKNERHLRRCLIKINKLRTSCTSIYRKTVTAHKKEADLLRDKNKALDKELKQSYLQQLEKEEERS